MELRTLSATPRTLSAQKNREKQIISVAAYMAVHKLTITVAVYIIIYVIKEVHLNLS